MKSEKEALMEYVVVLTTILMIASCACMIGRTLSRTE